MIDVLADMTYLTFHCRYGQTSIHRGCIEQLGKPDYVQILVNAETRKILLRAAKETEKDVFRVPRSVYEIKGTFGVNGPLFIEKLTKMMEWRMDRAYRVDGEVIRGQMMLFELDRATMVEEWHEKLLTIEEENEGKSISH